MIAIPENFFKKQQKKPPYVKLKLSTSLDYTKGECYWMLLKSPINGLRNYSETFWNHSQAFFAISCSIHFLVG